MKVRFSMEKAMCFWRGSLCHPTFGSSATCPALGTGTLLAQGLGTNREVATWRQNSTYVCGLPLINEMIDEVIME